MTGVRPNLPYSDTEQFSDKEMFPLFVEAPHGRWPTPTCSPTRTPSS